MMGSPYRNAFRQGSTLVPRRFVLVEPVPTTGKLPANPAFPLVRGRTGRQDKKPWRDVDPPRGTVEKEFLRPALLGESVVPFRVTAPLRAVIPWDGELSRLMDSAAASRRGYPRLADWLESTEELWEKNKTSDMSHLDRIDFHRELLLPVSGGADTCRLHQGGDQYCGGRCHGRHSGRRSQALLGCWWRALKKPAIFAASSTAKRCAAASKNISRGASGARGTSTSTCSTCRFLGSMRRMPCIANWPRRRKLQRKSPVACRETRESTSHERVDEYASRLRQTVSPLISRI